jgi:hypothetical protein
VLSLIAPPLAVPLGGARGGVRTCACAIRAPGLLPWERFLARAARPLDFSATLGVDSQRWRRPSPLAGVCEFRPPAGSCFTPRSRQWYHGRRLFLPRQAPPALNINLSAPPCAGCCVRCGWVEATLSGGLDGELQKNMHFLHFSNGKKSALHWWGCE